MPNDPKPRDSKPTVPPAKTRRGRPKMSDEKRDEMRRQIAGIANRLFEAEGYTKISMRRIAREVGCTPMAIYRYYDSKVDILRTLWGGVFENLFAKIALVNTDLDPLDYLIAISSTYARYWLEHPDHYRLVFMTEGVSQPEVSHFLDGDKTAQYFAVFGEAIAKADEPPISFDRIKMKLDMLTCILHGIAHNLITISGYEWTKAETLVEMGVSGLFPAPSRQPS